MNGKKTLPLFVIASMILSLLPTVMFASAALGAPVLSDTEGVKGLEVHVTGGTVPAGTTVYLYWDDSTIAWNGVKGLLNSTNAAADGSYEVWFNVPEAKGGDHYLWIKTTTGGISDVVSAVFTVNSELAVSPGRGLPLDTISVSLYGFDGSAKVQVLFDGDLVVTASTNSIGSATTTFKVPSLAPNVIPYIVSNNATLATDDFTIGPVITVTPSSGPVGTVVTISGRGFTDMANGVDQGDVSIDGVLAWITTPTAIDVVANRFRLSAVIPQVGDEDTFPIELNSLAGYAEVDFEVTALAKITVTPGYGAQASSITVSGVNFPKIAGEDVDLTMNGVPIGTATTLSDGTWSKTAKVPAIADGKYDVVGDAGDYNIDDDATFKVGTMNIILGEDEGPTGMTVSLTANGFEPLGDWNATIGDEEIGSGTVTAAGLISGVTWQVPQMAVGTYTVTVWDVDNEIALTTTFKVTKTTTVTFSVNNAPVDFEVGVAGYGFSDVAGGLNFLIYNKTSTGAADFWWYPDDITPTDLDEGVLNEDCIWTIDNVLSPGNYWMNVTDGDGYEVTVPFTVGAEHIVATNRKDSYKVGDVISFTLEHSYIDTVDDSYLKIWDPSGKLVFAGDWLTEWVLTGLWYAEPYSDQTAGGNPMTIADDAPLGTWTWKWYDNGDEVLKSGSFTVTASDTSVLAGQVADLKTQITALQTSVSTAIAAAQTAATSAGTKADAATAAATAAGTKADAATAAATAAGTKADAATAAANNAATAAKSAADAASGLTTLVYAAIGASLIAALAAIVALMQISRKIA